MDTLFIFSQTWKQPGYSSVQFSLVQSLSRVRLFVTAWMAAIALTTQTFVGKVMSLLLNMLSRLAITFLPRSKHLLISWLQSSSAVVLELQKIKSDTVSTVSPSISHEMMGPVAMVFVYWMLSFKPNLSLFTLTFIRRLLSSSSLSAIRVVTSAYPRYLIFLLAILIPVYSSSSPAFLMMYSACKWNKQGDNIQPWHTPFPIWTSGMGYLVSAQEIYYTLQIDRLGFYANLEQMFVWKF